MVELPMRWSSGAPRTISSHAESPSVARPGPLRALALVGLVLGVVGASPLYAADPIAERLSTGMAKYMGSLDERQRKDASYAFDDEERFDLRLAPLRLEGLRVDDMTDAQWHALEELLGGVLSADGLAKMNTIRSLEREVEATESGLFAFLTSSLRDAKRYFLAVFGEPGTDSPWGMRFDGHHLSLNWTAIPGAPLSATPLFLGGQPREVPADLERAGLRVLAEEEDRAVDFLQALDAAERARARIPYHEGSAIRRPMSIAGEVDLAPGMPNGLMRSALGPASQARFDALVDAHLANFAPAIADRYRKQILAEDADTRIVYAAPDGVPEVGRALYYLIEGGGFVIEFDDTAEAADHIHVVLRNPVNDFGRDILRDHLAQHPTR